MTKLQANKIFKSEILPHIPANDMPAISFEWDQFIDGLHRDGLITDRQVGNWVCDFDKRK